MPSDRFDTLIRELEIFARSHPDQYKWRVGWLAVVGYAYFVLLFLLLVIFLVGLQAIGNRYTNFSSSDLNSITAIVCLFAISMMGINFYTPKGIYLKRSQAPKLFTLIDELTTKLDTIKFHHVIINHEVNAGVLQLPRIGIVGWETSYLFIGLPLMHALSPDQFRSVLIHEFAHLSNHDSRFSKWIYQLRYRWLHIKDSLLLYPLLKWYVPFFNAYSFVLARMNEYAADRTAAEMVGLETESHSQIQLYLTDALLNRYFWQKFTQQARLQSEPPDNAISQQLQLIQTGANSLEAEAWLALALTKNTHNEDTHPCLRDRLAALGCTVPTLPSVLEISAAQYFLEDEFSAIATQLNKEWQTENREWWINLHQRSQIQQIQLDVLNQSSKQRVLSVNELWQQATLTSLLQSKNAAIPLLEALLEREPFHIAANYMLGEILLDKLELSQEEGDHGIFYLETVMQREPIYIASCCELIYQFLLKQGNKIKAQQYLEFLRKNIDQCQKAAQERHKIESDNLFLPHDCSSTEIGELALQLANYPEIQSVHLVRKVVEYFSNRPLYVLAITRRFLRSPDGSFYRYDYLSQILLEEITFPERGEWVIKILTENDKLGRVIRKVSSTTIYRHHF
jgi:Zn-dependent protease with chaperone function